MKETKWKDYLLKSGLPLEYEVKEILDKRKCFTSFEQSYLRPDENNIVNEFSYDIHSAYLPDLHFFDMMIECKYRDPSTNWIFIPTQSTPIGEMTLSSFVHVNDHFTRNTKHPFRHHDILSIAPECSKGIEITSEGQNPKTITQATSQLSYAMAEAIVEGMVSQYSGESGTTEQIFYHIPIIVTTANLLRLKDDISIDEIKKTDKLEDISTKEDCVVLNHYTGKDLEQHSNKVFSEFIKKHIKNNLNRRLKSFNKDVDHVCTVLAKNWCPSAVLIVNHSKESKAFDKLFKLMDEIAMPTEITIKYMEGKKKQAKFRRQLAQHKKQQTNIENTDLPF